METPITIKSDELKWTPFAAMPNPVKKNADTAVRILTLNDFFDAYWSPDSRKIAAAIIAGVEIKVSGPIEEAHFPLIASDPLESIADENTPVA